MSFKSVRSTRPVQFIPIDLITNAAYTCKRDEFHLAPSRFVVLCQVARRLFCDCKGSRMRAVVGLCAWCHWGRTNKAKFPDYPQPEYLLSYTQKYFFRHPSLRHLRVEQFNRPPACLEFLGC